MGYPELIIRVQPHPECRKEEIMLTNLSKEESLEVIGWKTKRVGEVAYDRSGRERKGHLPVFVQRAEVEAKGFTIVEEEE